MLKTHTFVWKRGYEYGFPHSETMALINSNVNISLLKDYTLVNIRLGKRGNLLLSRPCNHCSRIISEFKIGEVWYSNNFGLFERLVY